MNEIVRCPECKEKVSVDVDIEFMEDEELQEVICPCGCEFEVAFTMTIDYTISKILERGRMGEEKFAEQMAEKHTDNYSGVLFAAQ